MAKKFGKFLLFTAAVGSVAAAVYYYIRKKDIDSDTLEDEDYDDFSEDLDESAETTTNYVPLTPDTRDTSADTSSDTSSDAPPDTSSDSPADASSSDAPSEDSFVPLEQVAQSADKTEAGGDSKSEVEVEEFFDEDDDTDEEPPVSDN